MKKKVLEMLLAGVMTVGMLAGCSGNGGAASGEAKNPASKPESTKSSDSNVTNEKDDAYYTDEDGTKYKVFDDVKVEYLCCWNGSGGLSLEDQYNARVAKAIREKIGVTVVGNQVNSSETEKLNMMFASREIPTFVSCAWWGGSSGETVAVQKAIDDGMVLDLTELVPQYKNIADCWDVGVISQAFLMAEVDKPQNKGRRYFIPQQLDGSEADRSYTPEGVYVRQDVAKALNIDPASIKTQDQLLDFMKRAHAYGFKDANGNDTITVGCGKNGFKYVCYMRGFQDKKLSEYTKNEDGSISYDRLSKNFIDKNMWFWEIVNSGMMDVEGFKQSAELADQKQGNATHLFGAGHLRSLNATQEKTGVHDTNPEFGYVPVGPLNWADGSAGSMLTEQGQYGTPILFFAADADKEQIEATLTYLNYVNGKEGTRLSRFGIEGEDYILNKDGSIGYSEETKKLYVEDKDAFEKSRKDLFPGHYYYMFIARKDKAWFGKNADISVQTGSVLWSKQTENDYMDICPLEVMEGLSITAIASTYPGYTDLLANALDDDRMKEYAERAYFAGTEAEARGILESYQDFISGYNNGEMATFLKWLAEAVKENEAKGMKVAF